MDTANNTYPALQLPASELSAFAVTTDRFIISLKNIELIRFTPDNVDYFNNWIVAHNIRDIATEKLKRKKRPLLIQVKAGKDCISIKNK